MRIADRVTVLDVGRVVIDKPAGQITDVAEIQHGYLGGHRPGGPASQDTGGAVSPA